MTTRTMNLLEGINSGLDLAMEKYHNSCMFGEDVGYFGGVFRATSHLQEKYGKQRVFNTPLTEQGIIGFANGMASHGNKVIAEIQFADYIFPAFDQLVNETAKFRYRSGNEFNVGGLVVRTPYGGGINGGLYHSQSPEAYFTHTPGLRVVVASNPKNAKGLLLSSLESEDPVILFEPKKLYRSSKAQVDEGYYTCPLGKAEILKEGSDITLLAWGAQVEMIVKAAKMAEDKGISCEVIDLCSLLPWDIETVCQSVTKTGRLIINHEAPITSGFGAEVSAKVQENCFLYLESPIIRVCGIDTPFPLVFEKIYMPNEYKTLDAILESINY